MLADFYDELKKLERLHTKNQHMTVFLVQHQIRQLDQRTLQLRPTETEAEDVARYLHSLAPLLVKLIQTRRQVQMSVLTWIVNLNHVFGAQTLREFSTAIVRGVIQSPNSIRKQFVLQTLIHATRFDCQILLSAMEKRDMKNSRACVEMHRYMTSILKGWSHFDIQYHTQSSASRQ